jgi:lysophospholipase
MESAFATSADGTRIHHVVHGDGERDVLILGGLAEHAGRYAHVAEAWTGRNARVTVMELRGHGHSGGARSHVLAWGEYAEDVRAVSETLRPGWSMLAHSMGGLVALDAVRAGLAPARLALSNPLCGVKMRVPGWKAGVGRALSRLWPTLALANDLDPAHLSRDPEVGKAYLADPNVYAKVTARWFTEMTAAQARVAAMSTPAMPVRFFLSDDDPITDAAAARSVAGRIGAEVQAYPGMLHELVNELGKEAVIADVGDWLLG